MGKGSTKPYDAGQGWAVLVTEKSEGECASQADCQHISLGFFGSRVAAYICPHSYGLAS